MLEHGNRRDVRAHERATRHDDRLLQRELSGLYGVRNHVGEHDPGGTRRKFPAVLRAARLERRVRLEKVMESQHETIVGRARFPGDTKAPSERGKTVPEPAPR